MKQSRRDFLKLTAISAGAAAAARLLSVPYVHAAGTTDNKLRIAVIGCGGQGIHSHIPNALRERLVALVDPDERCIDHALGWATSMDDHFHPDQVRTFSDYRAMFDAMANQIDAVQIATPNHQHALPAMLAMKLGKHVYVEKPMAHDINEVRTMAKLAGQSKVTTQMGNQGHSGDGWRRLCEYIWAGAIGQVKEVHCWTNRANGGEGPRPVSVTPPKGMQWDSWIGPAPYRDYHMKLHPHSWHGWYDFGNGSLGNMGCHILDGAHWALKLGNPSTIELEEITGGSHERYPLGTRIRWDYPARGEMAAVKIYWYDGKRKGIQGLPHGKEQDSVSKKESNRPAIVLELEKKFGRNLGDNGSLFIGEKGHMWADTYGTESQLIPEELMRRTPRPQKIIPRIKNGHFGNFYQACRGGDPACSNFEVASKLTEMVLLGNMAIRAGAGKPLEWDGEKCTNRPEINQYMKRENRKGWEA